MVRESGLTFDFRPGWHFLAWDRHTYYQGLSARGLKAVDFLAFHKTRGVFLMEVKNFRDRRPPPPGTLTPELLQKARDTLTGLEAIREYLARGRVRRWLRPAWTVLPPGRFERAFWTQLVSAFSRNHTLAYLVWLEGAALESTWRTELQELLRAEARPDPFRPVAGSSTDNPFPSIVRSFNP